MISRLYILYFKLQFTSHQRILIADFGWTAYHVKCLILSCLQILFLLTNFVSGAGA
jgi:hypothetical protein